MFEKIDKGLIKLQKEFGYKFCSQFNIDKLIDEIQNCIIDAKTLSDKEKEEFINYLNKLEQVDGEGGYEGDGDYCNRIFQVGTSEEYIKFNCRYESYYGASLSSWNKVKPEIISVISYVNI